MGTRMIDGHGLLTEPAIHALVWLATCGPGGPKLYADQSNHGLTSVTARKRLSVLVSRGAAERIERGKYVLTRSGWRLWALSMAQRRAENELDLLANQIQSQLRTRR